MGHQKRALNSTLIKHLYEERNSTTKIATLFNCSPTTIRKHLRVLGYQIRKPWEYRKKLVNPKIVRQLYVDEELSTREVAKKLDSTEYVVYKTLRKLGCVRNTSEAIQIAIRKQHRKRQHNVGRRSNGRYSYVKVPDHPKADVRGYVAEHILVWEEYHHRRLPVGDVIHHINGIKDDNRPRNLLALPIGEHHSHMLNQALQKRIRKLEIENRQLRRALENSQMILYLNEN